MGFGSKHVPGGERELLVGVDDQFSKNDTKSRCIPREDVAEVVVQAALEKAAVGRSFDLVSHEPDASRTVWNKNLGSLLKTLDGRNCNYDEPKHELLGN